MAKSKRRPFRIQNPTPDDNENTIPPSGGWCNSCERYDCGHYVFEGMVITKAQNEAIVNGTADKLYPYLRNRRRD